MKTIFEQDNYRSIKNSFSMNGYVRVPGVFGKDEIDELRNEVERVKNLAESIPEKLVWFSPSAKGGYVIQRISRINLHSELIHELGHTHPVLLEVAGILLGVPQAKFADGTEGSDGSVLVVKDPNNTSPHKELRWHRDAKFTQHLPINPFINLGVYLDDSGPDLGGLVVLPSSHRTNIFDLSYEETANYHKGEICVEANTGDILVHSSELWHCSRVHRIPTRQRRVLYFNYYPAISE